VQRDEACLNWQKDLAEASKIFFKKSPSSVGNPAGMEVKADPRPRSFRGFIQ
jgi:hypothetical protein